MSYDTAFGVQPYRHTIDNTPVIDAREIPAVQSTAGGWRTWPWRTIIFLHVVFLLANIDLNNLPFPVQEAATINQIQLARDEGMPMRRVAFFVLGIVAIYGLARGDYRRLRIKGMLSVLMVAFFGWSCMSLFWAEDPDLALRRIFVFVLLWMGAGWSAIRLSPINLLRFAFVSNFLTLLACIGVEAAFGHFKPWVSGYRLGGLYHPNETGQCLAVAAAAGIALAGTALTSRYSKTALWYVASAAVAVVCLIITGSRTALSSLLCAVSVYWVIVALARWRATRALLAVGALVVGAMLVAYVMVGSDVLETIKSLFALGRSDSDISTLTMRTPMWHEVINRYIWDRPLLGYGYGAFWSLKHILALSLLQKGTVYFHSHSGYLEMALSIGVVGAAVHVLTLVLGTKGLVSEYRSTGDFGAAFGGALMVMLMVSMVTEPTNMSSYLMPTFLDMAFLMHISFVASREAPNSWRPWVRPQAPAYQLPSL